MVVRRGSFFVLVSSILSFVTRSGLETINRQVREKFIILRKGKRGMVKEKSGIWSTLADDYVRHKRRPSTLETSTIYIDEERDVRMFSSEQFGQRRGQAKLKARRTDVIR